MIMDEVFREDKKAVFVEEAALSKIRMWALAIPSEPSWHLKLQAP